MTPAGFPHSEISGSRVVCTSPELIAAYHVLHRHLTPRHPPSALSSLTEQKVLDHSTFTLRPRAQRYRHPGMQLSKIDVAGLVPPGFSGVSVRHRRPRIETA